MKGNSIQEKIKAKGVTRLHISKMVGIDNATLSRILAGKQSYVSEKVLDRINTYLDSINTDNLKIFDKCA